jgi:hypothetical protein
MAERRRLWMDEVAIWDVELSAAQVKALYETGVAGKPVVAR